MGGNLPRGWAGPCGAGGTSGQAAPVGRLPGGGPISSKKWGKEGQGGGGSSPWNPFAGFLNPVGRCSCMIKRPVALSLAGRPRRAHRLGAQGWGGYPSEGGGRVYSLRWGKLKARPHPTRLPRPTFPQGKAIGKPCGAKYRSNNLNVAKHVGFPLGEAGSAAD